MNLVSAKGENGCRAMLTVDEVAKALDTTPAVIRELSNRGKLKRASRQLFGYHVADVNHYLLTITRRAR